MQVGARSELAGVEPEFSKYRAAQRNTPATDLARQLAAANEQARRAEAKAEKAMAAKQGYKEQVCVCLSVSTSLAASDHLSVAVLWLYVCSS